MQKHSKEFTLLGVFGVLFILMCVLSPDKFFSGDNFKSMAFQLPEFGIFTLGMMIVIFTGGINLSLVSTAAISGITCALILTSLFNSGMNVVLAMLIGIVCNLVVALICGVINGFSVGYGGAATAMVVTLGTSTFFEGIGLNITKGGAVSGFPDAFAWFGNGDILGIPVPMIIFIIIAFVTHIVLERTAWGQSIYSIGCNAKASTYSGMNVKRILVGVYLYSAVLSSLATIIMISRYNSAKVDYGSSYVMQSVSAAVLGGTNIMGGSGTVLGTVLAVFSLQVISSGLNILGMKSSLVDVISGLVLILVLTLDVVTTKKHELKLKKA